MGLARSFTLVSELHLGVRSEEIADEIPRVPLIGLGVRTGYFVGAFPSNTNFGTLRSRWPRVSSWIPGPCFTVVHRASSTLEIGAQFTLARNPAYNTILLSKKHFTIADELVFAV